MATEEEDLVMRMYEVQAIVIEKDMEIEALRKRIEEMERKQQGKNQGEPSSSSREVRAAITAVEGRLEESMRNIQDRLELVEETDRFDRIERRLEEIVTRFESNEALNAGILERMTTLEDKMNGKETIVIFGGQEKSGKSSDNMVILDRKTSTWKVLNLKLPCKNSNGGSVYLNDAIYVFGGNGLLKKLCKLDSQQMKWIELAEMNEDRRGISNSSLVFQGCIWVFGGWNENAEVLNTVEKYCPERNEWIKMPGMSKERSWGAVAVCNEKIFVSGGYNPIILRNVECFDPTSGVWTPVVDMPNSRWGHSMVSDGSSLFVMAGRDGNRDNLKTALRIRPSEENAAWEELQPMNESRRLFTAKSLGCSTPDYKMEIYAIGGGNYKEYLDSVELFNGERWRHGPKLPKGCDSMSSVVILPSLAETLLQW